jgi:hypothetical protein
MTGVGLSGFQEWEVAVSDRRSSGGRVAILMPAVVLTTVALTTVSCGSGAASGAADLRTSPKEMVTMDPTPTTGTAIPGCGRPFRPPAGGALTLTGRFPATAPAGQGSVTGTVEATSRVAVRGVLTPSADVFLVRDGRVATMPVPQDSMGVRWDLAPGESKWLPGEATLISCEPAGGSVRPGSYQLYARVLIAPDDGAAVESFGGPWPLQVR